MKFFFLQHFIVMFKYSGILTPDLNPTTILRHSVYYIIIYSSFILYINDDLQINNNIDDII